MQVGRMGTVHQHVEINNRFGLHTQPVGEVARIAYEFDAIVAYHKGARIAHAHSVMELLALGACQGERLKVTAMGHDAEKAPAATVGYLTSYPDGITPSEGDTNTEAA